MTFAIRTRSSSAARASLALLACSLFPLAHAAFAQQVPTQFPTNTGTILSTPQVELFGGYTYVYPHAVISGVQAGGTLPLTTCLCGQTRGGGGSFTYNINRWFGVSADVSGSTSGSGTGAGNAGKAAFFAYSAGPKFTYRTHHFAPFGEVLIGEQRLSPTLFTPSGGFGVLAGGGLDAPIGRHFGIRIFRADYVLSNHQFGPSTIPATDVRGLRLESGVIFLFGRHGHAPAAIPPAPQVAEVVSPAPIAAKFVQPLTLNLVANPAAIMAGQSSTIVANAASPGVGQLTYTFEANGGTLSGAGATMQLATAGMGAGEIQITGHVADEAGQHATAMTTVMVTAAAVAEVARTSDLGAISFARDTQRPVRVDNEAKALLDSIAMSLQRDSTAQLALIGNAAAGEPSRTNTAAQRAVDTKAYLVQDKGIDSTRIVLYTGTADSKTVDAVIVPLGAKLDSTGDTAVDESTMKAQARKPLGNRANR